MPSAQSNMIIITIFGVICMLAGIGLIISGAVGLYDAINGYNGSAWALLWAGIGLELIGSTLFAIVRRMRWHHIRCHQHPRVVTNVQYVTSGPSGGYAYPPQAYTVQGVSGQPIGVPQNAAYPPTSIYAPPPGPSGYEYTGPPPMNHAPPAYEGPK